MNSNYITSVHLNTIEYLLNEELSSRLSSDLERSSRRLLLSECSHGVTDENSLRIKLHEFIKNYKSDSKAIDRWDDEGGASAKGAKS